MKKITINVHINKQFKNYCWDTKSDENKQKNHKRVYVKNKINKNNIKEIDNALIYLYVFIEKKKKYMKLCKLIFET